MLDDSPTGRCFEIEITPEMIAVALAGAARHPPYLGEMDAPFWMVDGEFDLTELARLLSGMLRTQLV
jgi:hypothetical protein